MVKVKLSINQDGYIDGWGSDWTVDNCYALTQEQLDSIVLDRSRYADGEIITDGPEIPEPEPAPSAEETITALEQENKELKQRQEMAEEALLSLSDMLLNR
ncbi:hypothetical protein [Enterococcus diestrammenae]|uniref:hypothetical protein n=1 Tax=Enterococcus diestrammenae TaxID=1155073 RepID=UPI0022E5381E|nr:hypothetical protein [Enterococcus diestrammenae]